MRSFTILAALILLFSILYTDSYLSAQASEDRIFVDLPERGLVAETMLEPRRYEFREVSEAILRVYKEEDMTVEAAVISIPTEDKQPAEETKLVLTKFDG